jgi:hypothetical protein
VIQWRARVRILEERGRELKMKDDQASVKGICRRCGCKEAMAAADARAVGLLEEFLAGNLTCCQVVQWADEQWLAWQEAGREDGKSPEEVTSLLEVQPDALLVPVCVKKLRSAIDRRL